MNMVPGDIRLKEANGARCLVMHIDTKYGCTQLICSGVQGFRGCRLLGLRSLGTGNLI